MRSKIGGLALSGGMLFLLGVLANIVTNQDRMNWMSVLLIIALVLAAVLLLWHQEQLRLRTTGSTSGVQVRTSPVGSAESPRRNATVPLPSEQTWPRPPPGSRGDCEPRPEHHGHTAGTASDENAVEPRKRPNFARRVLYTAIALTTVILVLDSFRIPTTSKPLAVLTVIAAAVVTEVLFGLRRLLVLGPFVLAFAEPKTWSSLASYVCLLSLGPWMLLLTATIVASIGLPFAAGGFWPSAVVGSLMYQAVREFVDPWSRTSWRGGPPEAHHG